MTKIKQIRAAANVLMMYQATPIPDVSADQWRAAQQDWVSATSIKTALKMCAVIEAAESMGYDNTADNRKVFWSKLKELNND